MAKYSMIERGGQFVIIDEDSNQEMGTSGSEDGAQALMADLNQREDWKDNPPQEMPDPSAPSVRTDYQQYQQPASDLSHADGTGDANTLEPGQTENHPDVGNDAANPNSDGDKKTKK